MSAKSLSQILANSDLIDELLVMKEFVHSHDPKIIDTPLVLNGEDLQIGDVVGAAMHTDRRIELSPSATQRIERSFASVQKICQGPKPVYGVNTGFGSFAQSQISSDSCEELSHNLITSHAIGTGKPLPNFVVRAAMIIRLNAFCKGFSGVSLALVNTLLGMINQNVIPEVLAQGSLACSGDLCLLAQVGLVMFEGPKQKPAEEKKTALNVGGTNSSSVSSSPLRQDGYAWYQGERLHGAEAMKRAGIARHQLGAKEGLAFTNGSTFTVASASLSWIHALEVYLRGSVSTALNLEALNGYPQAYDARVHAARGHPAQAAAASHVRALIAGSKRVGSGTHIQDPYSLRCAPQVHGACLQNLAFARDILQRELNAATDNPLICDGEALSSGNFHGEPIGMAIEMTKLAACELAAISERRTARLLDDKQTFGLLPPMLIGRGVQGGLHSGLMIAQYTQASLVLDSQSAATPDVTQSLPTSANQEDHNSNAWNGARHLARIVRNSQQVLALELFSVTRALNLRKESPSVENGLSPMTASLWAILFEASAPFRPEDHHFQPNVEQLDGMFATQVALPLAGALSGNMNKNHQ